MFLGSASLCPSFAYLRELFFRGDSLTISGYRKSVKSLMLGDVSPSHRHANLFGPALRLAFGSRPKGLIPLTDFLTAPTYLLLYAEVIGGRQIIA